MAGIVDNHESLSDINVTPFVDVLLVLLVIFMITAPMVTQNMEVQLPEEKLRSNSAPTHQKFIITINHKGRLWLNKTHLSLKEVLKKAISWRNQFPREPVFIRADKRMAYGKIVHVMAQLKNIGINNIGLLVLKKD